MNTTLAVIGSLGGFTAFLGAIVIVVRSIFKQVRTTEDNTRALDQLKNTISKLDAVVDDLSTRLARLEGRRVPR